MKTILISLFLLGTVSAIAQTDSANRVKTSLSLQARDWLYLNSYLAYNDAFENVYDSVKSRLRATVQPTLTTVIKVDSIRQGQVIRLSEMLRQVPYWGVTIPYSRINTALRATPYLITVMDAMDANAVTTYNTRIQGEIDKLRAVLIP